MVPRFDAYSATTTAAKADDLLGILFQGGDSLSHGKGFHTFGRRVSVRDYSGTEVGSVQWGGRQGERVMFEVKGERSPKAIEGLRSRFEHRCTRVDSCADFEAPGAFDELLGTVLQVKADHKLWGNKDGDWEFPELGRTQYLGARASAVRARLYEKGKQPEYRHLERPDWARLEVQVRPTKMAKLTFSEASALSVWGASGWTRQLAEAVLAQKIAPNPAGTVWKRTERQASLRWMCKQYATHLVGEAADLGGFDMLGLTLGEILKEQQQPRGNRGSS
jgi:hypothetical protein